MKNIKKFIINNLNDNTLNYLKRTLLHQKIKITSKENYERIKQNEKFRNIYQKKRCFVLGNGPSLKDIDFSLLRDEIIFTVNNVMRIPGYEKLNTNFHLWSDPDYFNGKYDENRTIHEFTKMSKEKGIECFVPLYAYSFFENNNLLDQYNLNYFRNDLTLNEDLKVNIDITNSIHICRTVVQYAVIIAMYMGFNEIYLLGCDATSIINIFEIMLNTYTTEFHAYSSEVDEQREQFKKNACSTEYICYSQYLAFLGWRKLAECAEKNNITLINCSNPTLIDSIKRKTLSDVLTS